MDSGSTTFAELLQTCPVEALRLLQFCYEPLRYIHHRRLKEWIPSREIVEIIGTSKVGWDMLNGSLLKELKLPSNPPTKTLLPRQKLVYATAHCVHRLIKFIGAAIFSEEIRRTILRQERHMLMKIIGGEIYQFALRKAVFFHPRDLPFDRDKVNGKYLAEKIINSGKFCVTACLCDLPVSLQRRFLLKFDPKEYWFFPKYGDVLQVDSIWKFVERIWNRYC
ncbi:MAG: Yop proteins translocation protein K [Puniceicoccales bacterium]|nr:Yop proteins translocation protein K [Puniceicoccales bacterium]